jgi:type IV pilus modification protein PilV
MMSTSKNSQSGFSLVEMLVAVVIIAVGLLGLAQLQVTAIKVNSQSMTSTTARALAQKVVEEIAATDADDPMFSDGASGLWDTYTDSQGGGTYTVSYNVAQMTAGGNPVSQLFNITVTVESETELMHVLGAQKRKVVTNTLKRAI